ncbi:uncharacterized protein C2845_PM01G41100 [Panicum miliaceum]|uniref:Uncharacterized protein n=1 Tax=Panicum miliaceum TaxID=4540 RepID=A0A3L6TRK2_PANMI|nr:uncharacterized protein C2845_PM01G41100 [Panicum miliaceum]
MESDAEEEAAATSAAAAGRLKGSPELTVDTDIQEMAKAAVWSVKVCTKNFGGLLSFKPYSLDRQLLSWLMRKLNPETINLEIGGGKEIAITEHNVWKNWCKAVVDNVRKTARLYKKDFAEKGITTLITGCGIFLMMLYVDNLQHGYTTIRAAPLRSLNDTYYSVSAVAPSAPQVDHGCSAAAVSSAHRTDTSHTPGVHAAINLQPPSIYHYPSFSSSFGQSVADAVGRSRKSKALKILKAFDDNTSKALSFMENAIEYTSRENELIAKAHHECFSAMQKLLVDDQADKIAANNARRRARPGNVHTRVVDDSAAAPASDDSRLAVAGGGGGGDEDTTGGDEDTPCPSPLEVHIDNDAVFDNSHPCTPSPRNGNADAQETGILSNSFIITLFIFTMILLPFCHPSFLISPSLPWVFSDPPAALSALCDPTQGVDSICNMLQTSSIAEISNDQVHTMQQLFFSSRFCNVFYAL